MTAASSTSKSRLFRLGICLAGAWLAWLFTPYHRLATDVVAATDADVQVFGHADFHAAHRVGVVAGVAHQQGCLQDGISPPSGTNNAVDELAAVLRAQGINATVILPGPLASADQDRDTPPGVFLTKDCTGRDTPETGDPDKWYRVAYPSAPSLTHGMAMLPFDAVLVVNVVTAETHPYSDGSMLFGTVSPASADYELAAQWIGKDGAIPWSAEAGAQGHLRHPGIHLKFSGQSGPAPKLQPVKDAAIARLAALLK